MFRRILCMMAAAAVVLGMPLIGAGAVQNGSIRVTIRRGAETVSSGSVTLYPAGDAVSGGYRLKAAFGGGLVTREDADSPALARWLAEQAGENGTVLLLDADGSAEFSRLEEGLYLVVQQEAAEGYYPVSPFLVQLPLNGQWTVEAEPKAEQYPAESPRTGESPALAIAAGGMLLSGMGLAWAFPWGYRRKQR